MDNNQDSNSGRSDGRRSNNGQGRDNRSGGNSRGASSSNRGSFRGKVSRAPGRGDSDRKPFDRDNSERKPFNRDSGDRRPYDRDNSERKPFNRDSGERKPYDRDNRERKPYDRDNSERKPFNRDGGERKPFNRDSSERKPFNRDSGERRPYDRDNRDRKPFDRDNSERKPFNRDSSERKPFNRDSSERRPYDRDNRDRKPFDRDNSERRPFNRDSSERKPFNRDSGERRPYDRDNRDRKPFDRDNSERRPFNRDNNERKPFNRDSGERRPYDRDNRDRKPYDRDDRDNRYKARESGNDEYKPSERLDDDGYRAGVSAVGMFVKPKYNKKFSANQDKMTDPAEMSDAGKNEVEEGIREDRLEGRNPIKEALVAGRTIDKLWVLKPKDGRWDKGVSEIVHQVKELGGVIMEVERPALDRLSVTNAHQGMIAQTAVHDYVEVADILAAARAKGEDPLIILLDEIKDSYNLGSVFRIADAAGAHGIIIPRRRSVGLDAIVAKASAGAIEHVPCARVTNLVNTMEELKKEGLWIAGTAMEGSSELTKTDLSGPMAVVIGSEGEGLRDLVRQRCDFLVSIPMKGKVNSLNAAVAAGVIVFEAVRQRDAKNAAKSAAASEDAGSSIEDVSSVLEETSSTSEVAGSEFQEPSSTSESTTTEG